MLREKYKTFVYNCIYEYETKGNNEIELVRRIQKMTKIINQPSLFLLPLRESLSSFASVRTGTGLQSKEGKERGGGWSKE